ncbi:hypothetical protein A9Q96_06615 [Rhodobacterales bacterium 52_120_T64]|nr:hypothetical protein A9Q96_06615 [Rhodobacterales bacterium 52_120_T64]
MNHQNLDHFLRLNGASLPGPIAVILAEDDVELAGTIKRHRDIGFGTILVIGDVAEISVEGAHFFPAQLNRLEDSIDALNKIIAACTGKWIYYGFNAEYLYFPFSETRTIKDAINFIEEERRTAVFTYAIDLYPANLSDHANGVDIDTAHLDRNGYYGQDRFVDGEMVARQPEIFGGLRWRYEEHIPWEKRRIDRISLFKATRDLEIGPDLRLNDPEMNTIACEWHNNLTIAVMSFRVAKALMHNPGSADVIKSFHWGGSRKFEWSSGQLMELGFMEPGQWF